MIMDITAIVEQGFGALVGGAITGVSAWVAITSRVKALEVKAENIDQKITTCQSEREICRSSIRDHHENSDDKHVTPALTDMIQDILKRVTRVEDKLMNGSK